MYYVDGTCFYVPDFRCIVDDYSEAFSPPKLLDTLIPNDFVFNT
jgi:hypothetical protein